ncbi:hypothetical protein [Confluentibacter sediminis]|uniref:hypothetical protein n=1 Tax=Confluentibacter sediminis TaxID=2219045 RepID=UPI000DAEC583|nr:hypothetical protein [Confluentibacter sediminis]
MNKELVINTSNLIKEAAVLNLLKKGVWLYFFLLIFEGALRKWFLPFLSTPLLIVRDPLAIWLIYYSWKHNVLKPNMYVLAMTFIVLLSFFATLSFGHGNLKVAIFGVRVLIIHFPAMFIIGKVFDKDDVIKMGKVLLLICIPMVILIGLQFYSPQSAWVNRGVGGDIEGAGFSGSMGYFRPPGTFSFTTGNVMFFSFVACFVFYFWLAKIKINRIVLIAATFGLLAAIPLSISRTLMFSIGVTLIFTLFSVASNPKFFLRMFVFVILGGMTLVLLSNLSFFQTATEAFTSRFEVASREEGGVSNSLIDRFFGGMIAALGANDLPFFGYGLGMGTNAGAAMLLTKGKEMTFLISEQEWLRVVGEMGFVLGILVLLIKVIFCADISMKSYKSLKSGNLLPWLLLSFGLLVLIQGQWAQPTVLGFATLSGGLILASAKKTTLKIEETE